MRDSIPAPYRGTGHAFDRRNDECGEMSRLSRIGVRDMLSYPSPPRMPYRAGTRRGCPSDALSLRHVGRPAGHAVDEPGAGQAMLAAGGLRFFAGKSLSRRRSAATWT